MCLGFAIVQTGPGLNMENCCCGDCFVSSIDSDPDWMPETENVPVDHNDDCRGGVGVSVSGVVESLFAFVFDVVVVLVDHDDAWAWLGHSCCGCCDSQYSTRWSQLARRGVVGVVVLVLGWFVTETEHCSRKHPVRPNYY